VIHDDEDIALASDVPNVVAEAVEDVRSEADVSDADRPSTRPETATQFVERGRIGLRDAIGHDGSLVNPGSTASNSSR
jgi:hypothetical protein